MLKNIQYSTHSTLLAFYLMKPHNANWQSTRELQAYMFQAYILWALYVTVPAIRTCNAGSQDVGRTYTSTGIICPDLCLVMIVMVHGFVAVPTTKQRLVVSVLFIFPPTSVVHIKLLQESQ